MHVFYSRWPNTTPHTGWLWCCEIAHAVADNPYGPYRFVDVALKGRGAGFWDNATIHNPTVHKIGGHYVMYYLGSSGTGDTPWTDLVASQRVGMAVANSLDGPWIRQDQPLILPGAPGSWDDMMTTNPAYLQGPDGKHWLFYKSMSRADWDCHPNGRRKYGLAIANQLEGPYIKHPGNPVLDVSHLHPDSQLEDAFVWQRTDGGYAMIARDMGAFDATVGLYFESSDGVRWSPPKIGYLPASHYLKEEWTIEPDFIRFERPQLLFAHGQPSHLFAACRGGRGTRSTAVVLEIAPTTD